MEPIQLLQYQMVRALCRFDINLVQTMAPGRRQIVSEVALDLITIPVVSALIGTADFFERCKETETESFVVSPLNGVRSL